MATVRCLDAQLKKMNEPHQRVKSGKLRKSTRYNSLPTDTTRDNTARQQPTGILRAADISTADNNEDADIYRQTPRRLCRSRINILRQMAEGYGVNDSNAVDENWRQTWNIGTWSIGDNVTLSINIVQPNVAACWINVSNVEPSTLQERARLYNSYNLSSSSCSVVVNREDCQLQGRWSLDLVDALVDDGLAKDEDIVIAGGLNICQSKLFCWLLVGDTSVYLCTLTRDSMNILSRYVPNWALDIEETTAAGSMSIKIKGTGNDATQLILGTASSVQYQGSARYLTELPSALATALRSVVVSPHLYAFLNSLEYKYYDSMN